MTFLDEMKKEYKAPQTMPATGPSAAPVETPVETAIMSNTDFGDALPVGAAPLDPAAKAAEEAREAAKPKPPEPEKPSPPIRIAGKEFTNIADAMAYAETLEIANREDKAFREGVEAMKKPGEAAPPPKTFIEEAENMLWEDPQKAIALIVEGTKKEIFATYDKMTTEQREEAIKAEKRTELWNNFYASNADLTESREYIDYLLQKNWPTLGPKPADVAMSELADMARKSLKVSREAALPRTELQSSAAIQPGASVQSTGKETPATPAKADDFISQMNQLRKRK